MIAFHVVYHILVVPILSSAVRSSLPPSCTRSCQVTLSAHPSPEHRRSGVSALVYIAAIAVMLEHLLLGLEVVEEDAALLGLLTPVLDDDARAVDDLAGVTFAVDLAY